MHTTQEEFNKGFIRMMDSLRKDHKGENNCNGVFSPDCPIHKKLNGCNCLDRDNLFEYMQIVWDWNQEHPVVTNRGESDRGIRSQT